MRNRHLYAFIVKGLQVDTFELGQLSIVSNSTETTDTLVVNSYIAGEVNYRFGNVYFAIIETDSGWKVGALSSQQYRTIKFNWQEDTRLTFKDLPTFDTPLIHTLHTMNIYPIRKSKFSLNDETISCALDIKTAKYHIELHLTDYSKERLESQFWNNLLKTIKQIFILYDTDEAIEFLAKNEIYFPE